MGFTKRKMHILTVHSSQCEMVNFGVIFVHMTYNHGQKLMAKRQNLRENSIS